MEVEIKNVQSGVTGAKDSISFNQYIILFILASVQFTHIMDFVIMMPMNPILQGVFKINNKEFGMLVSAYAASAGVFGFITFFFIDRFDRKKTLLLLYIGFAISTLGCAIANNYTFFLIARIASGAFGGILGSLVLAIIGDVFHESKRGFATGIVMASFSVASVIGIPTGLYFAVHLNWHFPFYLIVGLSSIVILVAFKYFPNLTGHMDNNSSRDPFTMLSAIFSIPNLRWSLLFTCLLMLSAFSVTPYLSDYLVSNVGFLKEELIYIYILGGAATIISGPLIGKLADRFGKHKVFVTVAVISLIPIMTVTTLPPVVKAVAYSASVTFFIFFGGRFIPAMAISTSSVERKQRGGFMSITGSLNQLASAFAAFIGGVLIGEKVDGIIMTFWMVGLFSVIITVLCILVSFRVKLVSLIKFLIQIYSTCSKSLRNIEMNNLKSKSN
jgi:predicted MFS family arabinose efflux permease